MIWSVNSLETIKVKIVDSKCHILKLKWTKFDFGWSSASALPQWGSAQPFLRPFSCIHGVLLLWRGEKETRKEKGEKQPGKKGRGRKGEGKRDEKKKDKKGEEGKREEEKTEKASELGGRLTQGADGRCPAWTPHMGDNTVRRNRPGLDMFILL